MALTFIDPVSVVCTGALQDLGVATPGGHHRTYRVRAANVGSVASVVDLVLTNGTVTINLCANHPVAYNDPADAPDLEELIDVPAGFKLRTKSGGPATTVEVSILNGRDTLLTDIA